MSTDETTPAVEPATAPAPAQEADASTAKPASRTRPTSTVDPKKKVARPSTGGATKRASFGGSGGSKKAAADPNRTYSPGEIVLARLKGYPPWPGRIANPEDLSADVKKAKPGRASNLYAVEFFPVGDFAWLPNREIQALSSKEINDFLGAGHRKGSGEMQRGYEIARDPASWDAEQQEIRQARADEAGEEDELDDEDEEEEGDGKKRKKAVKAQPKAKKAKTAKKNGLSKAEVEDEDEAPKSKAAKGKADKSKAKPVSKPETQAPVDDDPLSQNPECVKVKDWRHKLQRAFLGKALPESKEMDTYDSLFKTIEEYKDITIDALTYSKIGKVMKKIATLTEIPRNDDLKITDRAAKLMQDWQDVIAANGSEAPNGAAAKTEAGAEEPKQSNEDPAVNGTGEGEASGEKTEAETKMDVEPTPA